MSSAHSVTLTNLQNIQKGSLNAATGVANNNIALALKATAEAERRGAAPSGFNVHMVGNKIVVGKIPNFSRKVKSASKWVMNRPGHYVPVKAASAPARVETASASEQPQVGLPPLRIPMGAFPPQRAREPGTPTPTSAPGTEPTSAQSSNKLRRRRARKTRRTRKN